MVTSLYRNFVFGKPNWILAQFTNCPTIRPSFTTRIICCTTFCTGAFLRTVSFFHQRFVLAPLRFACFYLSSTNNHIYCLPCGVILRISTLLVFFVHGWQPTLLPTRVCFFVAPGLRDVDFHWFGKHHLHCTARCCYLPLLLRTHCTRSDYTAAVQQQISS